MVRQQTTYDWRVDPEGPVDLSHARDVVAGRLVGGRGRRQVALGARVPVHPARPRYAGETRHGCRRRQVVVVRGGTRARAAEEEATAARAAVVGDEDDGENGKDDAEERAEDDGKQGEELPLGSSWQHTQSCERRHGQVRYDSHVRNDTVK